MDGGADMHACEVCMSATNESRHEIRRDRDYSLALSGGQVKEQMRMSALTLQDEEKTYLALTGE